MQGRIPVINGLRGVAILGVVYTHLFWSVTVPGWHAFIVQGFRILPFSVLSNSSQCVVLFFVLSGFVLTLPYAQGRRSMTTGRHALSYYARRIRRLFPLLLGSAAMSIILKSGFDPKTWMLEYGEALLVTLMPFPMTHDTFFPTNNFVLWTLRAEIWFSALLPLLIVSCRRLGAPIVCLGVLAGEVGLRLWYVLQWSEGGKYFADSFVGRIDAFVLGVTLAFIMQEGASRLSSRTTLLGGVVCLLGGFWITDLGELHSLRILYPLRMLSVAVGFTLLTGHLVMRSSWLSRPLESPLLQVPGILCYSIYIWHGILIRVMDPRLDPVNIVRYLAVTAGFSLVSYLMLEGGSFRKLRTGLGQKTYPTNVTSSSTTPAARKHSHVCAPPSTSTDASPWKSPVGVTSA